MIDLPSTNVQIRWTNGWPLRLAEVGGRYYVASGRQSMSSVAGNFDVYELTEDGPIATYSASSEPVQPLTFDLADVGGDVLIGTSRWTNQGPLTLYRLTCQP